MKCRVQKKDIQLLLSKTLNIVEKRNTMPILVNVLLEAVPGGLVKVFATDLEVSITDSTTCDVEAPGRVAVGAKNLFDIVKELNESQPIYLSKNENNWLEIKQGKYISHIVGVAAEEYPVFPTYSARQFVSFQSQILKEMIDKTIYSVSTDETRYNLNGVLFEDIHKGDKQILRMVATDGHRLSVIDRVPQGNPQKFLNSNIIVPRKGLLEVRKMLEGVQGDVELAVEESQLIVRSGYTLLMIRLIEGRYPNYQQFIPHSLNHKVTLERDKLLSSLRRVSLLSNQKSRGVILNIKEGLMEISSNNPELGDAQEEIDINYSGGDLRISFNARFLLDALSTMEDEEVNFMVNDQVSPGLIRPQTDQDYTCVVMPMKI